MMGNKDYLSGGCDMGWCAALPGKLCYEKLDKKNQKMITWLCQKIFNENLEQEGALPAPPPLPPPPKKKKIKKKTHNRFRFFVKIHLLENSK